MLHIYDLKRQTTCDIEQSIHIEQVSTTLKIRDFHTAFFGFYSEKVVSIQGDQSRLYMPMMACGHDLKGFAVISHCIAEIILYIRNPK